MGPSSIFLQSYLYRAIDAGLLKCTAFVYIQLHKLFFVYSSGCRSLYTRNWILYGKKALLRARQVGHISSFRKGDDVIKKNRGLGCVCESYKIYILDTCCVPADYHNDYKKERLVHIPNVLIFINENN